MECSPEGRRRPQAAICVKNNIESYPTWFIGGKRYVGVLPPDRLAALTGYRQQP